MAPGEALAVTRILFDSVRTYCAGLGIAPGDAIRCEGVGTGDGRIRVRTSSGILVDVDSVAARFVQVEASPADFAPAASRRRAVLAGDGAMQNARSSAQ